MLRLEIVTPDTAVPAMQVSKVTVPAAKGRMTVLKGHQPLVCAIAGGKVSASAAEKRMSWQVGSGTLVVHDNLVTMLVKSVSAAD